MMKDHEDTTWFKGKGKEKEKKDLQCVDYDADVLGRFVGAAGREMKCNETPGAVWSEPKIQRPVLREGGCMEEGRRTHSLSHSTDRKAFNPGGGASRG